LWDWQAVFLLSEMQQNDCLFDNCINSNMWLLLIIVLNSTPPHNHKGSIFNTYTTEAECENEKGRILSTLTLKNSKITASCSYKDYLTPNKTF
jgi:hypothetical protein